MELRVGDRFTMKKKHPCGARCFEVLRVGADVRVRCTGCGRELHMTRAAFEKAVQADRPCPPQQTTTQEHET